MSRSGLFRLELSLSPSKHIIVSAMLMLFSSSVWSFPWHAQGNSIRGAELMAPEERKAYVSRLLNMKTADECKSYMQAHYLEIDKRAKQRNVVLPPVQGDPCEVMMRMGRVR
jgi:hypothetical protein